MHKEYIKEVILHFFLPVWCGSRRQMQRWCPLSPSREFFCLSCQVNLSIMWRKIYPKLLARSPCSVWSITADWKIHSFFGNSFSWSLSSAENGTAKNVYIYTYIGDRITIGYKSHVRLVIYGITVCTYFQAAMLNLQISWLGSVRCNLKKNLTNYSSFSVHFKIYFSFSTQTDTVRTTKL